MLPLWINEEFHSFPTWCVCLKVCVFKSVGSRRKGIPHQPIAIRALLFYICVYTHTHTQRKKWWMRHKCVLSLRVPRRVEGCRVGMGMGQNGMCVVCLSRGRLVVWSVPQVFPIFVVFLSLSRQGQQTAVKTHTHTITDRPLFLWENT